jgi:hypothetical protein
MPNLDPLIRALLIAVYEKGFFLAGIAKKEDGATFHFCRTDGNQRKSLGMSNQMLEGVDTSVLVDFIAGAIVNVYEDKPIVPLEFPVEKVTADDAKNEGTPAAVEPNGAQPSDEK